MSHREDETEDSVPQELHIAKKSDGKMDHMVYHTYCNHRGKNSNRSKGQTLPRKADEATLQPQAWAHGSALILTS